MQFTDSRQFELSKKSTQDIRLPVTCTYILNLKCCVQFYSRPEVTRVRANGRKMTLPDARTCACVYTPVIDTNVGDDQECILIISGYSHDSDIYGTRTAQQRRPRADVTPTSNDNNLADVELSKSISVEIW